MTALCECGCGEAAPISPFTSEVQGYVKGQPRRFVRGHQSRCQPRIPTDDRFFARVNRTSGGCWLWTGRVIARGGYGMFWSGEWIGGAKANGPLNVLAHRWAYQRFVGPITDGLLVLHRCDTPSCVNPEHLWLGTQRDNVQDCIAKGRRAKRYPNRRKKATA